MHGNGIKSFAFFTVLVITLLIPIVSAWFVNTHKNNVKEFHISTLTNNFFISPIVPLNSLTLSNRDGSLFDTSYLRGGVTLLFYNAKACLTEKDCLPLIKLYELEHALLSHDTSIYSVWMSANNEQTSYFPQKTSQLGIAIIKTENNYLTPDHFYVADPFGNIILSYAKNTKSQQIIDDVSLLRNVFARIN